MIAYQFSVIVCGTPLTDKEILDATDSLAGAGCADASLRGHSDGMELMFERAGDSLQAAIASAITDVERAGFRVGRVEMQRETIAVNH